MGGILNDIGTIDWCRRTRGIMTTAVSRSFEDMRGTFEAREASRRFVVASVGRCASVLGPRTSRRTWISARTWPRRPKVPGINRPHST